MCFDTLLHHNVFICFQHLMSVAFISLTVFVAGFLGYIFISEVWKTIDFYLSLLYTIRLTVQNLWPMFELTVDR